MTRLLLSRKSEQADPIDPLSVSGLLSAFDMAWHNMAIPEGTAMWLVPSFLKLVAAAALWARLALKIKSSRRKYKEGVLKECSRLVVNYLPESYATDDVITEAGNNILHFMQPMNSMALPFVDALWITMIGVLQVDDDYVLIGTLIDGRSRFDTACESSRCTTTEAGLRKELFRGPTSGIYQDGPSSNVINK